jgi:plasmid maintenance system antidote protein VapI
LITTKECWHGVAVRLEKAIGSTADTWLRMQMNYDLAQIRKCA